MLSYTKRKSFRLNAAKSFKRSIMAVPENKKEICCNNNAAIVQLKRFVKMCKI